MNVLLTNLVLATGTGTETATRDLALGLERAGHHPCIFTSKTGALADELRRQGIAVVDDLDDVPFEPDVIHGHHHVETTLACLHFPSVPAIFVCHDRLGWHDRPPRLSSIRRYVAVDRNCLERLVLEASVPEEQALVIPNAVDLGRFRQRGALPDRPRTALVFSNYATRGQYLETIEDACQAEGIRLEAAGAGVGGAWTEPENRLGDYDLVLAKGRCALEAMAVGCAVILCDRQGLGPMVNSREVGELREWNFGARCLQGRLDVAGLRRAIAAWDPADAARVSGFVRAHASLDGAVAAYLELYAEAIAHRRDPGATVSVGDVVEALVREASTLETRLRMTGGPVSMPPLPHRIGADLTVQIVDAPRRATAGTVIQVGVAIDNRSREALASLPPNPVSISYHWLDAAGSAVAFEGARTGLSGVVRPGSRHVQTADVAVPDEPGAYTLRMTLVQEQRFWFDALPDPVVAVCEIAVDARRIAPGDDLTLGEAAGLMNWRLVRDGAFANLGFLSDPLARMLTFVDDRRFVAAAAAAPGTACVVTSAALADGLPDAIGVAVVDDPRQAFFRFHNHLVRHTDFYGADAPTRVDPTARLHPRCHVDERNVVIGPGVTVGPNATILGRAVIGARTVIHPGAVLGSAGFQTSRRDLDPIEMAHAGAVEIGADCHVFAGAIVARGLFRQATQVGRECRIGNGAFVSHNCVLQARVFVGHGAVVNGNVRVGSSAWIGPGATLKHGIRIGDAAQVSLGATVTRDVADGTRVSGSFAIAHRRMLRLMAAAEAEKGPK